MDEPSSVERLWEEFKLKASADARERLILHDAPLVKDVAAGSRLACHPTSSTPIGCPTASSA